MSYKDERERLEWLRERQLRARDPRTADRKTMGTISRRRRKRYKRVTFAEMFRDIPHKWRGLLIGAAIGALISILLPLLFEGSWVEIVGYASIVVLALIGVAFGQAYELRDELRDFSRRK